MRLAAFFFAFCLATTCRGQTAKRGEDAQEDDPKAILELGAATSWNTSGGAATFAPNLAAEVTPIENWLEIEAGVSPFLTRNSTEWDTDLLFKKPWTFPPEPSSCWESARSGLAFDKAEPQRTPLLVRQLETSCSGPVEDIALAGISNQRTTTASWPDISSLSE